ncbi:MAG TPA: iron-containing alcohol dehydrogenase [Candidatus Paceibacterota bacterium]|nr:iron-containing alcohol dehydrogenase [Verrucomicrobiota bacterium]HRZ44724.1 iron-containing alcohol dehydrogenase [Candidatus Paceibacterota bacterium]HRZ91430.1 iron-containing alcohol dehydrogenase [Candidatus Paceibacterota bacterium]
MENFVYHNPVKLVFGKGSIAQLANLIPPQARVLMTCGGGSIRKNGVYDQVKAALARHSVAEFGGIEPNPRYETLMRAVQLCREQPADFLLSVGGGSVLDGTKFIALAIGYSKGDPWEILSRRAPVAEAIPLGCVLTLPATGSEMNSFAVISRESTHEKLALENPLVYPRFSILDPETTFTLPDRQTANGVADAFAHVMEQYMTFPADAPLQDRQAEALLATLVQEGPKALRHPRDYAVRANLMWAATQALNGIIACGVPQDWTTHGIGHELTALYGLDHAQTLVALMPAVWKHQKAAKQAKLIQYGERIWGIRQGADLAGQAIDQTEKFFRSLGMKTRLSEYGIGADRFAEIADRFAGRGFRLGEHQSIGPREIVEILQLAL